MDLERGTTGAVPGKVERDRSPGNRDRCLR